ncbi:hypothetical protein EIP86_003797 [Pleurotus ostreatoroseus]|nr:hypothetical protein EIP86_003797 [Pleurotus ostreatoroseus]
MPHPSIKTRSSDYKPPQERPIKGVQSWTRASRSPRPAASLEAIREEGSPLTDLSSPSPPRLFADLFPATDTSGPDQVTSGDASTLAAAAPAALVTVKTEPVDDTPLGRAALVVRDASTEPPADVLVPRRADTPAVLMDGRAPLPPAKLPKAPKPYTGPKSKPIKQALRHAPKAPARKASTPAAGTSAGGTPNVEACATALRSMPCGSPAPNAPSLAVASASTAAPPQDEPGSPQTPPTTAAAVEGLNPGDDRVADAAASSSLRPLSEPPSAEDVIAIGADQLRIGSAFPSASPPPSGALWTAPAALERSTSELLRDSPDPREPHQLESPPASPSNVAEAAPRFAGANGGPATRSPSTRISGTDDAAPPRAPNAHPDLPPRHSPPPAEVDPPLTDEPPLVPLRRHTGIAAQLAAADRAAPQPAREPNRTRGLQIAPRPPGGYEAIHHATAGCIFDKQNRDQVEAWANHPGPKLGIQLAGHGACDRRRTTGPSPPPSLTRLTLDIICDFLGREGPRLTPPIPIGGEPRSRDPPYTFFLFDITPDEERRLTEQGIICTPTLTIIVKDISWATPYVVGVLRGYETRNPDEIFRSVRPRFENLLVPILDVAAEENEIYADAGHRRATTRQILASLRVRLLDRRTTGAHASPEFFIYAHIPVNDFDNYQRVRDILAAADWTDFFAGPGRFEPPKPHWCRLCHGADHPRGLCPLPATPGWLGPANSGPWPDDDDNNNNNDDDDTNPRPPRGGGGGGSGGRRDCGPDRSGGPPRGGGERKRRYTEYDRFERRTMPRNAY